MKYGSAIREAILRRILPPNSEPMAKVARVSGISLQTLVNWKNQAIASGQSFREETETSKLSSKERFLIVVESMALNETELGEFARSKGVYVEEILEWRQVFENAFDSPALERLKFNKVIKEKDKEIGVLQADLDRKNKALAEYCALDILRKKAKAIWGETKGE